MRLAALLLLAVALADPASPPTVMVVDCAPASLVQDRQWTNGVLTDRLGGAACEQRWIWQA